MPLNPYLLVSPLAGILVGFGNPALAFFVGVGATLLLSFKLPESAKRAGHYSLQTGIVLLGFGIQAETLFHISASYTWLVMGYIFVVSLAGYLAFKLFRLETRQSILVTGGTAICGGTAVVTLSPIVKAQPAETGAILGLIFAMNGMALLTFPWIGAHLELTQTQFGIWAALAIHDTASVVATAQIYGQQAAEIATTLKLGRTLWLIPSVLLFALVYRGSADGARLPTFVLLFVLASLGGSVIDLPAAAQEAIGFLSKSCLILALLMIGLGTSVQTLRTIPLRLAVFAIGLWSLLAPATLWLVIGYVT